MFNFLRSVLNLIDVVFYLVVYFIKTLSKIVNELAEVFISYRSYKLLLKELRLDPLSKAGYEVRAYAEGFFFFLPVQEGNNELLLSLVLKVRERTEKGIIFDAMVFDRITLEKVLSFSQEKKTHLTLETVTLVF